MSVCLFSVWKSETCVRAALGSLPHGFLFLSVWVLLCLLFTHRTAQAVLEHGTLLFSPGVLKFAGTTTTAMVSSLSSLLSREASHSVCYCGGLTLGSVCMLDI